MSTEAQKKASANYAKKMTKCVNLAFNKKTDADILEKLDQVDFYYSRRLRCASPSSATSASRVFCNSR